MGGFLRWRLHLPNRKPKGRRNTPSLAPDLPLRPGETSGAYWRVEIEDPTRDPATGERRKRKTMAYRKRASRFIRDLDKRLAEVAEHLALLWEAVEAGGASTPAEDRAIRAAPPSGVSMSRQECQVADVGRLRKAQEAIGHGHVVLAAGNRGTACPVILDLVEAYVVKGLNQAEILASLGLPKPSETSVVRACVTEMEAAVHAALERAANVLGRSPFEN